ncbi:MAG: hypothetical protein K6U14_12125 [Firmicutes bacterium]|nr:hypothetical protein [Alicyclobacillaceae bacterium]MCL6498359.1 hypothetical protein [Bacillota bacterium]
MGLPQGPQIYRPPPKDLGELVWDPHQPNFAGFIVETGLKGHRFAGAKVGRDEALMEP